MTFDEWRMTGEISPRVIQGVSDSPPGMVYAGGWWIGEEPIRSSGRARWFVGGVFSDACFDSLYDAERHLWHTEARSWASKISMINTSATDRKEEITEFNPSRRTPFEKWVATGFIVSNVSEAVEDPNIDNGPGFVYGGGHWIMQLHPGTPKARFWTIVGNAEHSDIFLSDVEEFLWENCAKDSPAKAPADESIPCTSERTNAIAKIVAAEFCSQVRSRISADKLNDAVEANKLEPNSSICHLHDVCDPNQIMIDTLKALDLHWRSEIFDEAYEIARHHNFAM